MRLSCFSFKSWLKSLGSRRPVKPLQKRQARPFRPLLEKLEDRMVPSTVYFNDFQNTIGSDWSSTAGTMTRLTAPADANRQFLGGQ